MYSHRCGSKEFPIASAVMGCVSIRSFQSPFSEISSSIGSHKSWRRRSQSPLKGNEFGQQNEMRFGRKGATQEGACVLGGSCIGVGQSVLGKQFDVKYQLSSPKGIRRIPVDGGWRGHKLIRCLGKSAVCHATVMSWVHGHFLLPLLLGIVLTSRKIPYSLTNEAYNDWGDWRSFARNFLGRRKAHLFEIVLNRVWC